MTDAHVPLDVQPAANTSSTLLYGVKAMEPAAWDRFVRLYGPLVYHWCRRAGLQEADAADVGQDVFRAVMRAIPDYRHDRPGDSFRGWLRTITRNKLRDFARKRTGADAAGGTTANTWLQGIAAESDDQDGPEDPDERTILYRRAVSIVLADYQEATRQAFLRVAVDRHDPADVARDLGLTVNAVYLAKSRIKKRLREEFADLLDT